MKFLSSSSSSCFHPSVCLSVCLSVASFSSLSLILSTLFLLSSLFSVSPLVACPTVSSHLCVSRYCCLLASTSQWRCCSFHLTLNRLSTAFSFSLCPLTLQTCLFAFCHLISALLPLSVSSVHSTSS